MIGNRFAFQFPEHVLLHIIKRCELRYAIFGGGPYLSELDEMSGFARIRSFAVRLHWKRWFVAWMVVLGSLYFLLPVSPRYLTYESEDSQFPYRFVDSRTLLTCRYSIADDGYPMPHGPINVVDVPTGAQRRLVLPLDPAYTDGSKDDWRVETSLERLVTAQDYVVAKMWAGYGHAYRLRIWNWRTGELKLDIDITGQDVGSLGELVWLQPSKWEPRNTPLTFRKIATGEEVASDIPDGRIDFSTAHATPDGRFVGQHLRGELHVWKIIPGVEYFVVPDVEHAAFSNDSKLLATISRARRKPDSAGTIHAWRIHDVVTGRQIAEQVTSEDEFPFHAIAFHDNDKSVVGYSLAQWINNVMYELNPNQFNEIDAWRWRDREMLKHRASPANFCDSIENSWLRRTTTPRVVVDRRELLDVATGTRFSRTDAVRDHRLLTVGDTQVAIADPSFVLPANAWHFPRAPTALICELGSERELGKVDGFWAGEFSPDGKWLVVSDRKSLAIWSFPLRRSIFRALLWSMVVPGIALLRTAWLLFQHRMPAATECQIEAT